MENKLEWDILEAIDWFNYFRLRRDFVISDRIRGILKIYGFHTELSKSHLRVKNSVGSITIDLATDELSGSGDIKLFFEEITISTQDQHEGILYGNNLYDFKGELCLRNVEDVTTY